MVYVAEGTGRPVRRGGAHVRCRSIRLHMWTLIVSSEPRALGMPRSGPGACGRRGAPGGRALPEYVE